MFSTLSVFRSTCAALFMAGLSMLVGSTGLLRAQGPGTVDPVFGGASPGLLGNVGVIVRQPDGKILVGGYEGGGVVRLNTDGGVDPGFQAGRDYSANALALQPDGKILVGGFLSQINGVAAGSVARLNTDGSLDTSFNASFTRPYPDVTALTLQPDSKILVGGYFTNFQGNGSDANFLVRLNSDGSVDASFNARIGAPNYLGVVTCALQPDGKILIGGTVTQVNGVSVQNLARLNANGSVDASFNVSVSYPYPTYTKVQALAVQPDGKILIAGTFTQVDGVNDHGVARVNADGSLDTGFHSDLNGALAFALQPDGKILVGGGSFSSDGSSSNSLVRLNVDGSADTSFNASTNDGVLALCVQPDGKVLAGGLFTQVNGVGTGSIVRLGADGKIDNGFSVDATSGPNGYVAALALQPDGALLIGGDFSQVNGVSHSGVARLKSDGSPDAGFKASTTSVRVLALQPDGKILVGGSFGQVDGVNEYAVARLNADGSLDTGFDARLGYSQVKALVLQTDGKILVGGSFSQVGDVSESNLVRLNADGSLDVSFNAHLNTGFDSDNSGYEVGTLAVQPNGKILVGGDFSQGTGGGDKSLVRLNADGSPDAGFNANITADNDPGIYAVAVQPDGKVLVGGEHVQVGGVGVGDLARLNADGSRDTTFNADVEPTDFGYVVVALAVQPDGKVLVGGSFNQVNGIGVNYLVRLNADGSRDPFFNPGGSGPNGIVSSFILQPDGKIFVAGNFTGINGVLRNHVARLNGGGAPDFFNGAQSVGQGFYYEQFPNGNAFGYYNVLNYPIMYHVDMGFEYFIDAQDGHSGAYLYDFASNTFWYTSPTFPFPYLYDFSLNAFLYYYPNPTDPKRYNTNGVRYFYNFSTGKIISK